MFIDIYISITLFYLWRPLKCNKIDLFRSHVSYHIVWLKLEATGNWGRPVENVYKVVKRLISHLSTKIPGLRKLFKWTSIPGLRGRGGGGGEPPKFSRTVKTNFMKYLCYPELSLAPEGLQYRSMFCILSFKKCHVTWIKDKNQVDFHRKQIRSFFLKAPFV